MLLFTDRLRKIHLSFVLFGVLLAMLFSLVPFELLPSHSQLIALSVCVHLVVCLFVCLIFDADHTAYMYGVRRNAHTHTYGSGVTILSPLF